MKYIVRRLTIGNPESVEITHAQFNEVQKAREGLLNVFSNEEKFNILCENYYEFEQELLDIRLRNTMFSGTDWSALHGEIFLIERRVINFLTTSRLFRDHLCHSVSSVYGKAGLNSFNEQVSEQYDSKLGYRVVEAMRNFVQHNSLIVSSLSLSASHVKAEQVIKLTITPSLSVSRIKKVGGFKAKVLKELAAQGETFDLKPLIREAMEGYAAMQAFVRELSAGDVASWEKSLSDIRKAYTDIFDDGEFALGVEAVNDADKVQESIVIFEDFKKRIRWLYERNRTDIRYASQVVTSGS